MFERYLKKAMDQKEWDEGKGLPAENHGLSYYLPNITCECCKEWFNGTKRRKNSDEEEHQVAGSRPTTWHWHASDVDKSIVVVVFLWSWTTCYFEYNYLCLLQVSNKFIIFVNDCKCNSKNTFFTLVCYENFYCNSRLFGGILYSHPT